jgi:hypothetical protein
MSLAALLARLMLLLASWHSALLGGRRGACSQCNHLYGVSPPNHPQSLFFYSQVDILVWLFTQFIPD